MSRHTDYYKVSKPEGFNSFLIGQNLLFEENLKFVYDKNGQHIEKIIPVSYIGPHLTGPKTIWKCDEEDETKKYAGCAYMVSASVIENY